MRESSLPRPGRPVRCACRRIDLASPERSSRLPGPRSGRDTDRRRTADCATPSRGRPPARAGDAAADEGLVGPAGTARPHPATEGCPARERRLVRPSGGGQKKDAMATDRTVNVLPAGRSWPGGSTPDRPSGGHRTGWQHSNASASTSARPPARRQGCGTGRRGGAVQGHTWPGGAPRPPVGTACASHRRSAIFRIDEASIRGPTRRAVGPSCEGAHRWTSARSGSTPSTSSTSRPR